MKIGTFLIVLVMVGFDLMLLYAMLNPLSIGAAIFSFVFFVILTFCIYAILKYEFSESSRDVPIGKHKWTMRYSRVGYRELDKVQEERIELRHQEEFMSDKVHDRNIETQAVLANEDEVYQYDERDEILSDYEELVDDTIVRECDDVDKEILSPIDKARLGSNTHGFSK